MILKTMFPRRSEAGFSLIEMAIVLVILGFIIGALLLPLQAQRSQLFQSQTENTLETAKKALLGYAQANGRLPCPATASSNTDAGSLGQESPLGGTRGSAVANCTMQAGYLPAATLGLQPTDKDGFALDAWNNRIRYVITADDSSSFAVPRNASPLTVVDASHPACAGDTSPDFTTSGNMSEVGLTCLAPNLRICADSSAVNCSPTINLVNNAVAVIFSTGANGALQDSEVGVDEVANKSATTVFYSRVPTAATSAPSNEFDDMVTWISPYVLYNAMIEAGQLH